MAASPPSPKPMNQAWQQASDQANALTLPERLWKRPQVQGITIDGPTSKDLDDAIYIESTPTGAIASIHIADVAELITVGSPLDKVALARTQTRYLKRGNVPMLPHALSEDKLSLVEGQPRPTITIQVSLNPLGEIQTTEIFESWIVSAKRFSYEQADRACQRPSHPFHDLLQLCQSWSERLNQERQNQGAIGGMFNASGFWVDENGAVMVAESKHFHAQMIIQEFMILANRAVAHWFAKRDVLALYRNHTARTIAPEREQIMQALLTTGSMTLIRQKLQNWMNKAEYNPTLIGHFALNLTAYCHFTSPIRRLADLLNHRIIKALIHEQPHPYQQVELEQLCSYIATLNQQEEAETKAFFKARSHRDYRKQIEGKGTDTAAALAALSDKEFSHIVKHAVKEHNFEPIRAVAIQRLEEEKLSVQSLYHLLIHSGDTELQHRILATLHQHPEDATSLLTLAITQEPTWEQLAYVEESQDLPPFQISVDVSRAGQVTTTKAPVQSHRKQSARHLACLKWLEAYSADELVSPEKRQQFSESPVPTASEQPEMTEPVQLSLDPAAHPTLSKSLEGEQNFVGLLQELCYSLGWPLPAYQYEGESPAFECTCIVQLQEQLFNGKETATQKKKAKQAAAKATLMQLQKWFQYGDRIEVDASDELEMLVESSVDKKANEPKPTRTSASISHPLLVKQLKDGQNFIGFLQQLCQTLVWDMPEYEFTGKTPEFICTCTVWAEGQCFRGEATYSKKQRAKYFASKAVLLALQHYF